MMAEGGGDGVESESDDARVVLAGEDAMGVVEAGRDAPEGAEGKKRKRRRRKKAGADAADDGDKGEREAPFFFFCFVFVFPFFFRSRCNPLLISRSTHL